MAGSDGADSVAGGDGNDTLTGDAGADHLDGGAGNDALGGGNDDDVLVGGPGADRISGDNGRDTADYAARTAPLTITLDGQANDGEAGEADNVAVETVIGGSGADKLTGGAGDEQLFGEGGNDQLHGGDGADTLVGGDGNDKLWGDGGLDGMDGGAGNDQLDGRDGLVEYLRCGAGKDEAWADKADKPANCEKTHTSKSGSGQAAPVSVDTPSVTAKISGVAKVSGGGRFVAIPGAPGQKIDRRLLGDLAYLIAKYHVRVTAGYALTGHAEGGEHPLGLAVDLVPGAGGSWDDVDRLAKWAEPSQNHPRAPFRWVGYNGDPNHGRGNHLHLSWRHTPTKPGHPAGAVWHLALRKPSKPNVTALASLAGRNNHALGRKPSIASGLTAPSAVQRQRRPQADLAGRRPRLRPALAGARRPHRGRIRARLQHGPVLGGSDRLDPVHARHLEVLGHGRQRRRQGRPLQRRRRDLLDRPLPARVRRSGLLPPRAVRLQPRRVVRQARARRGEALPLKQRRRAGQARRRCCVGAPEEGGGATPLRGGQPL